MIALASTLRAFSTAAELPSPMDYEVGIPPVRTAWCRRVPGQNLWIFYRMREDAVLLLFVTRSPPIPLE